MNDSQEKTLNAGQEANAQEAQQSAGTPVAEAQQPVANNEAVENETPATEAVAEQAADAPVAENAPETDDEAAPQRKTYKTKREIVDRLKEIAHGEETPQKDEVDYLKTVFYKLHLAEREAAMKAYIEGGGDPAQYQLVPDEVEEAFKAEMTVVKERRAKLFLEMEQEKQDNLKKKLDIIERIKAMVTSPDEANKAYQDFKRLQQEWKEIKNVPAEKANELWRNYQLYVEQFYDLLKLNSEAREYDFKKNLEIKTRLCEAAEKLAEEDDVVSATQQLQKLHQEYRETGPVAKDLREPLWARFKAASTVVNKRHQQHFEALRAKEEENLVRKTGLCEQIEQHMQQLPTSPAGWEKATKTIIALQTEWKTIGFAPQKMNVKIFERFRSSCDAFFEQKAAFFKQMKAQYAANAEKKQELIDRARALMDSTDWKATADKLVALQKEWKTVGVVPKRQGDHLWEEFLKACNHFFEARKAAHAGTHNEEKANLEAKRAIIASLKALLEEENAADAQSRVKELTEQYNAVGHVPYKEKDKLYAEYHEVLDALYKQLNMNASRRRLDRFKSNLKNVAEKGGAAIEGERMRLVRRFDALKQEIQTYENNIGFLSSSSKKGNSLIDEMNRKVQKLKDELALVKQQIKAVDDEEA